MGKLVGAMKEGFQVLVGSLCFAEAPVGDRLAAVADVPVAGAGVVDPLCVRGSPPSARRPAGRGLAEQIPQRDVDRRVAARFHACRAPAEIIDQALLIASICIGSRPISFRPPRSHGCRPRPRRRP